jgi:hypothetical protein
MEKQLSLSLAGIITALAVAGLTHRTKPKHLMGAMNVDTAHSLIRLPVLGALLYGGNPKTSSRVTRGILKGVGLMYLAIGTAGLFDRKAGGLLPSKLTNFDLAYHFAVGLGVLGLSSRHQLRPLVAKKHLHRPEYDRYPYQAEVDSSLTGLR